MIGSGDLGSPAAPNIREQPLTPQSWDITTNLGATALSVAAQRAAETAQADPVIRDEFAALLVGGDERCRCGQRGQQLGHRPLGLLPAYRGFDKGYIRNAKPNSYLAIWLVGADGIEPPTAGV
jgi:hypothetical protein